MNHYIKYYTTLMLQSQCLHFLTEAVRIVSGGRGPRPEGALLSSIRSSYTTRSVYSYYTETGPLSSYPEATVLLPRGH